MLAARRTIATTEAMETMAKATERRGATKSLAPCYERRDALSVVEPGEVRLALARVRRSDIRCAVHPLRSGVDQRPLGREPVPLRWPITSQRRGYPFGTALAPDLQVAGVVPAEQIESLDRWPWRAPFACRVLLPPPRNVCEGR